MKALDIMTSNVFTLREDHDLNMAQVLSEGKHIRHIPVVNSAGAPVGIIACRDVARALSNPSLTRFAPVRDVMSTDLVTTSPQTSVSELLKIMASELIAAVLLVEKGKLVGIVTERDVVHALHEYGATLLE